MFPKNIKTNKYCVGLLHTKHSKYSTCKSLQFYCRCGHAKQDSLKVYYVIVSKRIHDKSTKASSPPGNNIPYYLLERQGYHGVPPTHCRWI